MNTKSVSRKVYSDISSRISTSLSAFPASASEAIRLVDTYLEGDLTVSSPDPMAMLAFSMIKAELDRAMMRSARARERARKVKASKASATTIPVAQTPAEKTPVMLSRRERRAFARAAAKLAGKARATNQIPTYTRRYEAIIEEVKVS